MCETPVVCFDATGPIDIVSHKTDGYKAEPFDPTDLTNGIEWILILQTMKSLVLMPAQKSCGSLTLKS